jgi:hypothetical protein
MPCGGEDEAAARRRLDPATDTTWVALDGLAFRAETDITILDLRVTHRESAGLWPCVVGSTLLVFAKGLTVGRPSHLGSRRHPVISADWHLDPPVFGSSKGL